MCRARARRRGVAKVHKLSSNETPLGPSPGGDRGLREAGGQARAPIRTARRRGCATAIAAAYGLNPANIMCGERLRRAAGAAGADLSRAGDEAIFTEHGFLVYKIETLAAGGDAGRRAEKRQERADVDAILAA